MANEYDIDLKRKAAEVRKLEAECELLEARAEAERVAAETKETKSEPPTDKPPSKWTEDIRPSVKFSVPIGAIIRDTITGFQGVAVAIIETASGPQQVAIQSRQLCDGKPTERQWFDIKSVVVVHLGGIEAEDIAAMKAASDAASAWIIPPPTAKQS